jgi:hypothetical protein
MQKPIFITREGQRYGPYTTDQCRQMLATGQLIPLDLAWREGMAQWRPLGEVVPNDFRMASAPIAQMPVQTYIAAPATGPDESAAQIVGKMGCGCVMWIGLLALALGGGVVFPVLLIVLPFVVIGGIIDMVKKLSKLSKQRNRQF